jgi:hypothetical protein
MSQLVPLQCGISDALENTVGGLYKLNAVDP